MIGDVVLTPGVTGGVGRGVPPANACGGRLGEGREKMRCSMCGNESEKMNGGSE